MVKKDIKQPKGWHSRGYLPHFDGGEICQFITLHLADALPQKVVQQWKLELDFEKDEEAKLEYYRRVERFLDQGYGECYLGNEKIASEVQNALLYFDEERYKMIAWVVMPNHIHFLFKPINENDLSTIMKNFKSYTSHESNKLLNRSGKFWQEDYFDRFIRDHNHYLKTVDYIENNPVKAGHCDDYRDWKFSSAYDGARTSRPQ